MKLLFSLAKNTFREAVRDKIFYTIFFFGFVFLLSSPLMESISFGQEGRIMINFGITMIHIFGLFITIFLGSRLIFQEIEQKTIFLLIPKPVRRSSIILSKFLGLGAVLFCTTLLMSIVYFLIVPFSWGLLLTIAFLYLSFLLLLAIVLFFSAFMSPLMASIAGALMFVIGNITASAKLFVKGEMLKKIVEIVYHLFPNFTNLNLKNYVVYGIEYAASDVLRILLVTGLFIALFLFCGIQIFSRKEFS